MRYVEAPTYVNHVSALRAELNGLQAEELALCSLPKGSRTPEQQRRLAATKARMRTVRKNIDGADDLTAFTWPELFQLLVEADDCLWTKEQRELLIADLQAYEGRGERALRHRFGLPLEPTQGICDFPDEGEGKYLGNELKSLRVGKVGKRAYGRFCREVVRAYPEDVMTSEQWDALSDGEVSAGKVYHEFPEPIRACLQARLAPREVLSCYQTLYLMTDEGFVRVPRVDFADAFSLDAVSQMSPKYRLRRDYVARRLRRLTLAG